MQDDGGTEGRVQRYREAPGKLEAAVEHWLGRRQELSLILNLGDIINGNKQHPVAGTTSLSMLAASSGQILNIDTDHASCHAGTE